MKGETDTQTFFLADRTFCEHSAAVFAANFSFLFSAFLFFLPEFSLLYLAKQSHRNVNTQALTPALYDISTYISPIDLADQDKSTTIKFCVSDEFVQK